MGTYEERREQRWEKRPKPEPPRDTRILIEHPHGKLKVFGCRKLLQGSFAVRRGAKDILYFRMLSSYVEYPVRLTGDRSEILHPSQIRPESYTTSGARVTFNPGTLVCSYVPEPRHIVTYWHCDEAQQLGWNIKASLKRILMLVECPRCRAFTGGGYCTNCTADKLLTIVDDLAKPE